ncbi:MAG: DUF2889 domain-containing protein [Deltaproteobacteria bacterium]|nr:DUF2889 domain-containing protein [Deltaproteobacteria bacterium]
MNETKVKGNEGRRLVHTRRMEMKAYDLGENRMLVEGELFDTRDRPPLLLQRTPAPKRDEGFLIHGLVARLWVQGPDLTILDAQAGMPHFPQEGCPEVLPWMKRLVGLKIAPGFTQKVKGLIGGTRGCAHLTNLFLEMGAVAVQGYWTAYGRGAGGRSPKKPALSRLSGNCYVWRADGPLARSIRSAEKEEREP